MTPKEFSAEKNKLLRAIKARIKPLLYPSGYQTGSLAKRRPLLLWVPPLKRPSDIRKKIKIRGLFIFEEGFEGFTEDGVIADSYGGGLATVYWKGIPIEDLYRINCWLARMQPKLLAIKKAR